jgi:hypothetical protein
MIGFRAEIKPRHVVQLHRMVWSRYTTQGEEDAGKFTF